MRPTARLCQVGLLAGLAWPAASDAADSRHRPRAVAAHQAKAPARQPAATAPAAENLVVHGQKRFSPAPMPNQEIHDPADQLRDPNTGASIGRFGHAYIDANPVPPINPELKGDQSPIAAGVQR